MNLNNTLTELELPEAELTLEFPYEELVGQLMLPDLPAEISKTITEQTPLESYDTTLLYGILKEVRLDKQASNLPDTLKTYWKPEIIRLNDKYSMMICTPEQFLLRPTMTNLKSCHCLINSGHGYRAGNLRYLQNPYWGCIFVYKHKSEKRAYSAYIKDRNSDDHEYILAEEFPTIDQVLADTPNVLLSMNVYRTRTGIMIGSTYGHVEDREAVYPFIVKELLKKAHWVGFCSSGLYNYAQTMSTVAPVNLLSSSRSRTYLTNVNPISDTDIPGAYGYDYGINASNLLDSIPTPPQFDLETKWYNDFSASYVSIDGKKIWESRDSMYLILGDYKEAIANIVPNANGDYVDNDDYYSTQDVFEGSF